MHECLQELDQLVADLGRGDVDGLITLADPFFTAHRERLAKLALAARVPTMFHWREFVEAGGLLSYGPDNIALYRRAAHFVDRILGRQAGDIADEVRAGINLQTAKKLGIFIPLEVLARADEVFE